MAALASVDQKIRLQQDLVIHAVHLVVTVVMAHQMSDPGKGLFVATQALKPVSYTHLTLPTNLWV